MPADFPRIEDIIDALTANLGKRGFCRVDAREHEAVRYEKKDSSIKFQVGIEQEYESREEPQFNHIYLALQYKMPEGVELHMAEYITPLLHYLFRNTKIYHHGFCIKANVEDETKSLLYHIGFEKNKTNAKEDVPRSGRPILIGSPAPPLFIIKNGMNVEVIGLFFRLQQ